VAAVGVYPCDLAAWPPPRLPADTDRQSTSFPAPPALAPAVAFWREVFVRYDSHQTVLHDREDMSLVWEVINLPVDERGEVDESAAERLVRQRVEDLRARLRRLAANRTPVSGLDVIILASVGANKPERLRGAWSRVRAQRGIADKLHQGLARSKRWFAEIHRILAEEGIPRELVALPFVESAFNPRARSAAGAAGAWQLMPATARWLGLKVDRHQDERFDTLKATRAAAKMLRKSYQLLGSWPLALTAYNHGPYGVQRAVRKTGSRDLVYLIEHYRKPTWGFASKNFYAEFLAMLEVIEGHPGLGETLREAQASL
jgi:membrane-bound lytic murein transglycosylase D